MAFLTFGLVEACALVCTLQKDLPNSHDTRSNTEVGSEKQPVYSGSKHEFIEFIHGRNLPALLQVIVCIPTSHTCPSGKLF